MLSQIDLKRRIAAFPDHLPLTDTLEKRIKIGVGFNSAWYRSQREHWLGWLAAKEHEQRTLGKDPASVTAGLRWRYLNCGPMMLWLAEATGVDQTLLESATRAVIVAAKAVKTDHPSHGKAVRTVISWNPIEPALAGARAATAAQANAAAAEAFDHLASQRAEFRRFKKL